MYAVHVVLYYLKKRVIDGVTFQGYYKTSIEGRFSLTVKGLRYFSTVYYNGTVKKKTLNNFYYVGKYGKLSTAAQLRYIPETTTGGKILSGWVTLKKYYLNSKGKRFENCWKGGYYLLDDGTIAVSMRVQDGSYVDHNGRKCAKNEMALSSLKSQINKGKVSYTSSVKSNLWYMITESDNEAYNQIVMQHTASGNFASGAYLVNQYLRANGYVNTECHTTLSPSYTGYISDGLGFNKTSAKDCGVLLEKIYKGTCVSKKYSKEMLNLLKNQKHTWKIPYVLPTGVITANKTGETSTTQHDMAIVYGAKTDYVLYVFSSSVSEDYGIRGIQEISAQVYKYLN